MTGTHEPIEGSALRRIGTVAAGWLAVVLVVALALGVPIPDATVGRGRALFALGFLLLAGMAAGQLAALLRLPRLTGYLLAGIVAGPHGMALFGPNEVHALSLINTLALALIALQAGAEFTLPMLRVSVRSLTMGSVGQIIVLGPALFVTFLAIAPLMPFTEQLPLAGLVGIAAVWAAIGVSKSPAATLAVLTETHAKGPVARYALGMVVVFDVLVLVFFSVAILLAQNALQPEADISFGQLLGLGEELVASVAAGTTFGLAVAAWLALVNRERLLFVVVIAYAVTAFCRYFHYDTLLVFVIAGFIVQNLSRQGQALVDTAEKAAGGVMVVFFATAGAHLDLTALSHSWRAALVLVVVRIVFTWLGCRAGHRLARDEDVVRRYGFTSLLSQAGVTIGLVTVAAEKLPPDVGGAIAALGIAVVGINELIGPVVFKLGLARASEIPASQDSTPPVATTEPVTPATTRSVP